MRVSFNTVSLVIYPSGNKYSSLMVIPLLISIMEHVIDSIDLINSQ